MKRIGVVALLMTFVASAWVLSQLRADPTPDLEQLMKKATVDGQYRMLLAQIKVPGDKTEHGEFKDLGVRARTDYAEFKGLPRGYWVYAHPYWYIWRDRTNQVRAKRAWGPEQAAGEPDTDGAGDIQTAWASQMPDGQDEWLLMEYAEPVQPTAVLVHETYNPGALVRVTAFKLDGEEVELWKGKDPTTTDNDRGVSEIPVKADFKTKRIKIYIASSQVEGWNEIDAVGIRDKNRTMHWAVTADASSTFAPPFDAMPAMPANPNEMRLRKLEDDVRDIKAMLADIKKKLEKKDK